MNLKVYWPFTENELKRNLAYKGSFYLFMLCSCFGAFISYYLWMAIYGSSSTGVLGGFTKNEMVIYFLNKPCEKDNGSCSNVK